MSGVLRGLIGALGALACAIVSYVATPVIGAICGAGLATLLAIEAVIEDVVTGDTTNLAADLKDLGQAATNLRRTTQRSTRTNYSNRKQRRP